MNKLNRTFVYWKRSMLGAIVFLVVFTVYFVKQEHEAQSWRQVEGREKLGIAAEEGNKEMDVHCSSKPGATKLNTSETAKNDFVSFMDVMRAFAWNDFQISLEMNDFNEMQRYSTSLLLNLVNFLKIPPSVPAETRCEAPLSQTPPCSTLPRPRKVGVLFQFGFDVDTLEIYLNELNATVDLFFLIESIKTHSSFVTSKPLIWETLKYDSRFVQFSPKIVHFIVDDSDLSTQNNMHDMWSREHLQEELRWRKFLEWNRAEKYFGDEDILGFGDVDEVPNRYNVAYLKSCHLPSDPVDIGIWFPFDGIDTAFATDFPVKNHKFTLGDPTFWTVATAAKHYENFGKPPTRMRGNSKSYLLGGMHLSRYAYPPFQMTKLLTATEATLNNLMTIIEVGMLYAKNNSIEAEAKLNTIPPDLLPRLQSLEEFGKENKSEMQSLVKIPWFLSCNRQRYPSFDKVHDSRLDAV